MGVSHPPSVDVRELLKSSGLRRIWGGESHMSALSESHLLEEV